MIDIHLSRLLSHLESKDEEIVQNLLSTRYAFKKRVARWRKAEKASNQEKEDFATIDKLNQTFKTGADVSTLPRDLALKAQEMSERLNKAARARLSADRQASVPNDDDDQAEFVIGEPPVAGEDEEESPNGIVNDKEIERASQMLPPQTPWTTAPEIADEKRVFFVALATMAVQRERTCPECQVDPTVQNREHAYSTERGEQGNVQRKWEYHSRSSFHSPENRK
jgi:hypothetical protein